MIAFVWAAQAGRAGHIGFGVIRKQTDLLLKTKVLKGPYMGKSLSVVLYAFVPQLEQNTAPVEGQPHDEHGLTVDGGT